MRGGCILQYETIYVMVRVVVLGILLAGIALCLREFMAGYPEG